MTRSSGADVTSTVQFVPTRYRKCLEINIFLDSLFENRSVLNVVRFYGLKVSDLSPPRLNKVRHAELGVVPHRQRESLDPIDLATKDLHVFPRIRHFFEKERGRMLAALQYHLDQPAHIFIPGNPLDAVQLIDGLHLAYPGAQIVIDRIHPKAPSNR
jgi:hypothetical protein